MGETVFEALQRAAKEKSLLFYPSTTGGLIFAKKGVLRSSVELRQGHNVLSASGSFNDSDRFSEYIVRGQNVGTFGGPRDTVSSEGKATDEGVKRYRPLLIISENAVDSAAAKERASYEAELRAARAAEVSVTVQGWKRSDGTLWDINEIVNTDIPYLGIREDLLVKEVEFSKSDSGTITNLTLTRSDAFEFSKKKSKDKDPANLLGWENR